MKTAYFGNIAQATEQGSAAASGFLPRVALRRALQEMVSIFMATTYRDLFTVFVHPPKISRLQIIFILQSTAILGAT